MRMQSPVQSRHVPWHWDGRQLGNNYRQGEANWQNSRLNQQKLYRVFQQAHEYAVPKCEDPVWWLLTMDFSSKSPGHVAEHKPAQVAQRRHARGWKYPPEYGRKL